MALVGMLLVGMLTRPGAPPATAWGCGGDDDNGTCSGGGVAVQASTGVTAETHTITATFHSCEKTLTFAAGSAMGEIQTAFETDLAADDQVRYKVSVGGSINTKLCTVSADGVSAGYIRANATPVGTIECGCGTTEASGPCK